MKSGFLCLLTFLSLLPVLPCMAADERPEATRAEGEARREVQRNGNPSIGEQEAAREEKRQFKSLWRQLSREEQEALRQQMREAWQHLTPEERQRALVDIGHSGERNAQTARERKDEKPHAMRDANEKDHDKRQAHKAHRAEHKAYWDSLSVDERAALHENLRAHLRDIMRRVCPNPQSAETKGQKSEPGCDKPAHH